MEGRGGKREGKRREEKAIVISAAGVALPKEQGDDKTDKRGERDEKSRLFFLFGASKLYSTHFNTPYTDLGRFCKVVFFLVAIY